MEKLILQNDTAELHMPNSSVRTISSADVMKTIGFHSLHGMTEEPLPETVSWSVGCGPLSIFLLELKPEVRAVRWITAESDEPMGPEAEYRTYRLATPFIILKVPFLNGRIHPTCELFYRSTSVSGDGGDKGLDSQLYWSNLLNVSPHAHGCAAWFCTQYLSLELAKVRVRGRRRRPGVVAQLDALVTHIFGGGFNRSSELHEGKSCFSRAKEKGVDPRVTDVDRWQAETQKNPRFMLDVEWEPVGLTIRDLLNRQLLAARLPLPLAETSELINTLLQQQGKGS